MTYSHLADFRDTLGFSSAFTFTVTMHRTNKHIWKLHDSRASESFEAYGSGTANGSGNWSTKRYELSLAVATTTTTTTTPLFQIPKS